MFEVTGLFDLTRTVKQDLSKSHQTTTFMFPVLNLRHPISPHPTPPPRVRDCFKAFVSDSALDTPLHAADLLPSTRSLQIKAFEPEGCSNAW